MTLGSLWQLFARETKGWLVGGTVSVLIGVAVGVPAVTGLVVCILAGGGNPSLPGLLVWLFMGPYLALTGWAAAVLGMAVNVRLIAGEGGANDDAVLPDDARAPRR